MQADINKLTISYFQSTEDYFWKWAEGGKVIEWSKGQTLCYWADVLAILKELAPSGLPPFSAVLLGLAMCQDNWETGNGKNALKIVIKEAAFLNKSRTIRQERNRLRRLFSMMEVVASLDKPLRSTTYRLFLLRECFRTNTIKIRPPLATQLIDKFESGVLDKQIFLANKLEPFNRLGRDLNCLHPVRWMFFNKKALEQFLKTSLDSIPEPLDLELPPEAEGEVLDALMEDERTMGIAKLTKRLVAALNIPMQTQGVSDQSYGGISDITNRGNFDKLLLSELANDNDTLIARLVNNEALYYHHEEPPAPLNRDRVLWVDTTLRMWGVPRIFALSAALACAKTQKQEIQVSAFAIDSQAETKLDLSNKKGVLHAMELLDGGMDCMTTLLTGLNKKKLVPKEEEIVLITNELLLAHPKYLASLEEIQQQLSYVITVDRSGALRFYQCIGGRRKLLSAPIFDLDILLNKKKRSAAKSRLGPPFQVEEMPSFLKEEQIPLLLPSTNLNSLKKANLIVICDKDAISELALINNQGRFLYWSNNKRGAKELLSSIERGDYTFNIEEEACWVLVNYNPYGQNLMEMTYTLYRILKHRDAIIQKLDLSGYWPNGGVFLNNEFYFYSRNESKYYRVKKDFTKQKVIEADKIAAIREAYRARAKTSLAKVKAFINNGYSVLQRISHIGVQNNGVLHIGKYQLGDGEASNQFASLCLVQSTIDQLDKDCHWPIKKEIIPSVNGQKKSNYKRFVWANGSRAILDRRGLLHLKSYNTNLPEVTIVLIVGKPFACWASDGTVCGNMYFIPYIPKRNITVQDFNKAYLLPLLKSFIVPKGLSNLIASLKGQ